MDDSGRFAGSWWQVGQASDQWLPEFSKTGSWGLPRSLVISEEWPRPTISLAALENVCISGSGDREVPEHPRHLVVSPSIPPITQEVRNKMKTN